MFLLLKSEFLFTREIKGTLMQIWKLPNIFKFIKKLHSGNFAFLIVRILELFTRKIYIFLKKYANF